MSVTVTSTPYDVSVSDDGSLVTVAATGPAGPSGASFIPEADSGTGTSVSSTLSVVGGTNITTSVDGTTVTVNASGGGTVTQVDTGTGLSGGPVTTTGTISLANTAVTPAEYAVGKFTVDQQGRITAASSSLSTEVSALFAANVESLLNSANSAAMRTVLGVKNHATIEADTTPQYFENLVESNDTQEFITNSGLTDYLSQRSQNLADLNSSATALTNLGGTTVGKSVFTAADAAAARTAIGAGTGSGDGDVVAANNLSDLANAGTARTNLGLGTAATSATGDFVAATAVSTFGGSLIDDADAAAARTTLGATTVGAGVFTAADQAAARSAIGVGTGTGDMVGSNNLSEITSESTARTNLGLGTAATSATGDFEASGSIATHNAITTAHGISAFGATLVDDADAAAARTTLGAAGTNHTHTLANITDAGTAAASATTDFVASTDVSAFGGTLIDDADAATARTTLGLGTAATVNTGTSAGNIVVLDGSAKLPAVDGSQLTNISGGGGGGTDYTMAPITQTWRYFDDFFCHQPDRSPNDGNNQFWLFSGGSGVTPSLPPVEIAGSRGVGQHYLNAQYDRYTYWGAKVLSGYEETDGDELIWESRLYVEDGSASSGRVRLGIVEPIASLNFNDTPPGPTYSAYRFAGFDFSLANTNVITAVLSGTAPGNSTSTDLGSSYPISNYVDTWFRLGIHAKYNATDSDWDITYYINGTSVGTTSMTFTDSLIPYVGSYMGTFTGNVNVGIDWISYQGNIGADDSSRINRIDIGDI